MIKYRYLVFACSVLISVSKLCKGSTVTGVEANSVTIQFTISDTQYVDVIYVKHPDGNNILAISSSNDILTAGRFEDRLSDYEGTNRENNTIVFTLHKLQIADAGTYGAYQIVDFLGGQDLQIVGSHITGVEGQAVTINFTISDPSSNFVFILVKHPNGSNILALFSPESVAVSSLFTHRVKDYSNSSWSQRRVLLTLGDLTTEDAGLYQADQAGTILGVLELRIIAKPTTPIISASVSTPVVGQGYVLNCFATSRSVPSNQTLPIIYQWYRNNVIQTASEGRIVVNNNILTISSVIGNDDDDIYECQAWEDELAKSNISEQYGIPDPDYGPTTVVLAPSAISYTVVEGTIIDAIICSSSCKPACTYQWRRGAVLVVNSATLDIGLATRSAKGEYVCAAKNVHNNSQSSTVNVTVHYKANITEFSILNTTNGEVEENSDVKFRCISEGNPDPSITIKFRGNNSIGHITTIGHTNIYTIPKIGCLDAGNYSCEAYNYINEEQKDIRTEDLKVRCSPRERPGSTPQKVVYASRGGTVTLHLYLLVYPPPTEIFWIKDNQINITVGIVSTEDSSNLTVTDISEEQFGAYNAVVMYENKRFYFHFVLEEIRVPFRPSNFNYIPTELTATSVYVTWTEGEDGGARQNFLIQYKMLADLAYNVIHIQEAQAEYRQLIEGLSPATDYEFAIFAYNSVGNSSQVGPLYVHTKAKECSMAEYISPDSGVIVGSVFGAFLFGILVTLLSSYVWFRCRGISVSKQQQKTSAKDMSRTEAVFDAAGDQTVHLYDAPNQPVEYEDVVAEVQDTPLTSSSRVGQELTMKHKSKETTSGPYEDLNAKTRQPVSPPSTYDVLQHSSTISAISDSNQGKLYVNTAIV